MIDRPEPVALLNAMATTLSEQVVPECSGGPQHAARVVANLCRILAREFDLGPDNREASLLQLQELLGTDGGGHGTSADHNDDADHSDDADQNNDAEPSERDDLAVLVARLDERLESGVEVDDAAVFAALTANVDRRLAIAKPDYR